MAIKTVTVDVDIDLDEFDDDDLEEECESRGLLVNRGPAVQEIYHALKFGLNDKALELTRAFVCDQLGMVL